MVVIAHVGIEYIGGQTEIKFPFNEGELLDPLSKNATPLKYLLNPFYSESKPFLVAENVLIIERKDGGAIVPDKQGTVRDKSTRIVLYKGDFSRGFRHGQGVGAIFNLSREYIGEYTGNWHYSMRHGHGELKNTANVVYRGEWKNDVKSGLGIEIDALGSKYIGSFHNDFRHGSGRFIWGDGTVENREYHYGKCVSKSVATDKPKDWAKWNEVESKINQTISATPVKPIVLEVTADDVASTAPEAKPFAGLAAKRELKQVQDTVLPKFNQLDVDWNSFTAGDRASVAVWMLGAHDGLLIFSVIVKAVAAVCQDPLGKQALAKLKKITLKNRDKMRELSVTVSAGALEIVDNFGYEDARLDAPTLQKKIESLI